MDESSVCVGCRIIDTEGYKATVQYIGTVVGAKNQSETWLGVEWDNQIRGKHDGSSVDSNGTLRKYFECASGSGSFIKPSKVTYGRSFMSALNERYVSLDAPPVGEADAFVSTLKGNQKSIEFVGEEKIRKRQQIANVTSVTVRSDTVSYMEFSSSDCISHLTEIDLQDNLLWSWSELGKLGIEASSLKTLLLHGNKMQTINKDVCSSLPSNCFAQLKVLVLNSCGIRSWTEIQLLGDACLPQLEELYLANNRFPDLPRLHAEAEYTAATGNTSDQLLQVTGFPKLRLLDLSGCALDEWSQVSAFGTLPSLQELVLDNNPLLTEILPPSLASSSPLLSLPNQLTLATTALNEMTVLNVDEEVVTEATTNAVDNNNSTPTDTTTTGSSDTSSSSSTNKTILPLFPVLRRFSLSSTGLTSWRDVDVLAAHYPHLRVLRLSNIPLFAGKGSSEVRPEVIARIPQLTFFNGSQITARERAESEKHYLRCIHTQYSNSSLQTNNISAAASGLETTAVLPSALQERQQQHPRYEALIMRYGADLIPASKTVTGPANLASELVSITFRNLTFGSNGSLEPVTKKLPRSITIARLQLMVKQLFGLDTRLQHLSLRTSKDSPPTPIDDVKATLQYYGAGDGAEIFINEGKA